MNLVDRSVKGRSTDSRKKSSQKAEVLTVGRSHKSRQEADVLTEGRRPDRRQKS